MALAIFPEDGSLMIPFFLKVTRFFDFLGIDRDRFGKLPCASGDRLQVSRARLVENFRSWWWRSVSSPLQVSGAVTRLAVYRAAPHNKPRRDNLQRRGYYSVSKNKPRTSSKKSSAQFREKFR